MGGGLRRFGVPLKSSRMASGFSTLRLHGAGRLSAKAAPGLRAGTPPIQVVELQARFAEQFLEKWVADLNGGSALARSLVHLDRGKCRAVDPITPGIGTDEEDDVTGSVGAGAAQALVANQANTHGVDDRIVAGALIEVHLAANGWTTEAIAVAPDAGADPLKQVAAASRIEWTETERIEDGDRPSAHGEDVAKDSANPGSRPLVGLDGRGMIV